MRQDELLSAPSFSIVSENETLADLDLSQLTTLFPEQRTLRDSPGDRTTNMDFYGADRKLSEIGDEEFTDFLDSDIFTPPASECNAMEHIGMDTMADEWLDNFFDDPVLNDKMMSEAIQPARVQSEHSYSLTNDETGSNSPIVVKLENDKDLEPEMLINPNMTMITTDQATDNKITIKEEPSQPKSKPTMNLPQRYQNQTLLKQPTIILATQQQTSTQSQAFTSSVPAVLPKVNIKVEAPDSLSYYTTSSALPSPDAASNASSPDHCGYDYMGLPPTPPSSSNSDSECGSPHRSAPGSPLTHQTPLARQQQQHMRPLQQPLFTSPIPTSGMLILSEEEKRTLITEGYPIPNKLPLTKQEEKNLKKIRRKIKNKISAQESRRKKKEYMETLEKRMEAYSQENTDLKKKCDVLENNNRSLLGQLHKLQALVSKVPMSASSTQTGTCLMVLVLFFAVFLGTWSPLTMSIGYGRNLLPSPSNSNAAPASKVVSAALDSPIGPPVQEPNVDAYTTPSMKSRVLMSLRDESEEVEYGPTYHDLLYTFLSSFTCSSTHPDLPPQPAPPQPHVKALITEADVSEGAVSMDLAVDYVERVTVPTQVNTTQ